MTIMRALESRRREQVDFLWDRDMNRLRLKCRDNPCALLGWSIALAGAAAAGRTTMRSVSYYTGLVLREDFFEIDMLRLALQRAHR